MKSTFTRLMTQAAKSVAEASFRLRFWDGDDVAVGDAPFQFEITFGTPRSLRRTLAHGFLGFGESYMDGDVEVTGDWDRLFAVATATPLATRRLPPLAAARVLGWRLFTRDSRGRARRNVAHHYDRGNGFYRLWLDESMTYSCAYFSTPDASLEEAQRAKLELVCRKLRLAPGMSLLDVGCGWGSLLIHAAREHGVRGVGCTLSANQAELATRRVREAGVEDRVAIRLQDYRDVSGPFDRWVSVGMFEHVGRKYIATFVRCINRQLRRGGVGLLHFIGKDRIARGDPWTLTYVFPGGYIPALPATLRALGRAGMVTVDVENLRRHYAMTLRRWRERFEAHAGEVRRMFDERFVRMWRLFLVSSAAGFTYLDTRLFQVLFTSGVSTELPPTRADLYREPLLVHGHD